MSIKQQIIKLFFSNNYSKALQGKFLKWLNSSSEEVEKDEALFDVWSNLDVNTDTKSLSESYRKTLGKINSIDKKKKRIPLFAYISRAAVVILLLASSFMAVHYYMQNDALMNEGDVEFVECFVPAGETRTLLLPDSTTVTLNSGTVLIYPKAFEKNSRSIYLNGEGAFTVKRDERKPFEVRTKDANIKVLGTVFNVSSYANNDFTSTTLKNGSVMVSLNDNFSEPVILSPNEQFTYNKRTKIASLKSVDVEKIFAWQNGSLIFQNETIEDLAKMLERKYDVDIYLNNDKCRGERVTARFDENDSCEDVFGVLGLIVPDFRYKVEGSKIYIY